MEIDDGRCFEIKQGILDKKLPPTSVWRVKTEDIDKWLGTVQESLRNQRVLVVQHHGANAAREVTDLIGQDVQIDKERRMLQPTGIVEQCAAESVLATRLTASHQDHRTLGASLTCLETQQF